MSVECEKRRRIVRSVVQSNAMEGLPLSGEVQRMLYSVADGKMTSEELLAILLKKHAKVQS